MVVRGNLGEGEEERDNGTGWRGSYTVYVNCMLKYEEGSRMLHVLNVMQGRLHFVRQEFVLLLLQQEIIWNLLFWVNTQKRTQQQQQ